MFELAATRPTKRRSGEPIDVTELTCGRLVQQRESVGGEGGGLGPGVLESVRDVLDSVFRAGCSSEMRQ